MSSQSSQDTTAPNNKDEEQPSSLADTLTVRKPPNLRVETKTLTRSIENVSGTPLSPLMAILSGNPEQSNNKTKKVATLDSSLLITNEAPNLNDNLRSKPGGSHKRRTSTLTDIVQVLRPNILMSPLPPKSPRIFSPLRSTPKAKWQQSVKLIKSHGQISSPVDAKPPELLNDAAADNRKPKVAVDIPPGSALLLELMPVDNNCLFNSLGYLFCGAVRNQSQHIRNLIASQALNHPNTKQSEQIAAAAIEYAELISKDKGIMGGEAELGFLAMYFECQIVVVQVKTAGNPTEIKQFGLAEFEKCVFIRRGKNNYYCPLALKLGVSKTANATAGQQQASSSTTASTPTASVRQQTSSSSTLTTAAGQSQKINNIGQEDNKPAVKVETRFPVNSGIILARIVHFSELIKENPILPLPSLSYLRVGRSTLLVWLAKALMAGALLAFIFAILILAGVRGISF